MSDDKEAVIAADVSRSPNGGEERQIYFHEIAPAIEFCFWIVVALAPFLRWVNGAAVTDDQFAIQVALVTLAATGAVGLRIYNWRVARRIGQSMGGDQSQRE